MLLSYVMVFMAVTPVVVGTTFFALGAVCANAIRDRSTEANVPSSQSSIHKGTPIPVVVAFGGCLPHVSKSASPRTSIYRHEASPPFRQYLLSIARGTARSDAPRMRRRPGTFRTRELSYRRLSAAGLRIAGCPVHLSGVPCAPVAKLRPDLSALVQPRS